MFLSPVNGLARLLALEPINISSLRDSEALSLDAFFVFP